MSKNSKKKQLIVEIKEPCFIHKIAKNGNEMTIMVGRYALPWKAITNIPLCDAVLVKLNKVRKAFPDAHVEFNFNRENPAFLFKVSGITTRHEEDKYDPSIGMRVAKAKAVTRAIAVSIAISKAIKVGLEEEINRTIDVLNVWRQKEKKIIKEI